MRGLAAYGGLLKLAGLLIGLPLVVYGWGIARTLELHRTLRQQAVLLQSAHADTIAGALPERTENAETDFGRTVKTGELLHRISPWLEQFGVTAERYTPYRLQREQEGELYAGELLLSGEFIPLTRLLERMESRKEERIVSVSYQTVVLPQNRKKQLQMTVIFQQITKKDAP
ncbi:MAG: hypothetical protein LUD68_01095 [Rikenellaceae bacterium]|nr:hypothetical protein [Rikenellaceae bacterium]